MPAQKKTVVKKTAAKKISKMPKWSKSPPELVAVFEKVMAGVPQAQTRQVVGYPAAFANGQMFAGLHQDNFILRLPDDEREAFLQRAGAQVFEPMPGRPMREYVVVPPPVLQSAKQLDGWLGKALAYAQSLPPKTAKAKRKVPRAARELR
jgi:TfoX/Sxy family transcriptional regulator of competence genes